ncbi:MAG: DMT family protein [Cytophaga sp.]|uniref:DMT family protein n=1 Tax=Cytophaga sp. TaxID=29535 RepID=UPI003F80C55D
MSALWTIVLLIISNGFMTYAWYGHLQQSDNAPLAKWGIVGAIVLSWGIAFFEYVFQVPANKIGFEGNGGPFNLFQLKIIQEVISLSVFTFFALVVFRTERLQWNYIAAMVCLTLAVFFVFKK